MCFDAYLTKGENVVYFEKILQKSVDKREKKVYNMRVALSDGIPRGEKRWGPENFFKKLSKKVLTKQKVCGIIVKLSRKTRAARSLKIEQQERLYKALRSAKYEISSKSYIYSTK